MKKFLFLTLLCTLVVLATTNSVYAQYNTPSLPLTHCYHWTSEAVIEHKYDWANKNDGELTFYGSGGMAGDGLYCAAGIAQSASYGRRVIKIEFVSDVIVSVSRAVSYIDEVAQPHLGHNYCGLDGQLFATQEECDKQEPDVVLFHSTDREVFYVIKNVAAVLRWSSNSTELSEELAEHFEHDITRLKLVESDRGAHGERIFYNQRGRATAEELAGLGVTAATLPTYEHDPQTIQATVNAKTLRAQGYFHTGATVQTEYRIFQTEGRYWQAEYNQYGRSGCSNEERFYKHANRYRGEGCHRSSRMSEERLLKMIKEQCQKLVAQNTTKLMRSREIICAPEVIPEFYNSPYSVIDAYESGKTIKLAIWGKR